MAGKPPNGQVTPAPRGSGGLRRWLMIVPAVYGLAWLAQSFPAHSKTLARDATVIGFVGALLVIQEVVRELLGGFGEIVWMAAFATLTVAVFATPADFSPTHLGFTGLLSIILGLWLIDTIWGIPRDSLPDTPLFKYGAIVLGSALLVLAMFLQLRAIGLSKG